MHILYTDLYTFTMIFIWRICPPIQSFSGGESFPWFHDLYEWSFPFQCRRRGLIQCKKSKKPDILIGQWSKKLTDSQSNASLGCRNIWIRWKFASETMAGVLRRFSFSTATTIQYLKKSSNNKSTAFWLSVWKKWCIEKGIAKKIKITSRPSLTLCSSDSTPKLKTNMVKPRKRRFHFVESDSDTD